MDIVVASGNPVKRLAVERAFRRMMAGEALRVRGTAVSSGVGPQPMTDEETLAGATRRAEAARAIAPDAAYWVGLEGGVEETVRGLEAFAWAVVMGKDGRTGRSRTATFLVPPVVADLIRQGHELGEADDIVFGRHESKKTDGAVGILTQNTIDRAAYYEHALVLALVPFANPRLYP